MHGLKVREAVDVWKTCRLQKSEENRKRKANSKLEEDSIEGGSEERVRERVDNGEENEDVQEKGGEGDRNR